jgi:hypothetical protein
MRHKVNSVRTNVSDLQQFKNKMEQNRFPAFARELTNVPRFRLGTKKHTQCILCICAFLIDTNQSEAFNT